MSETLQDTQAAVVDNSIDQYTYNALVFKGNFTAEYMGGIFDTLHDVDGLPILMYLTSNGGSVHTGTMLLDRLKALDVPVTIISELFNGSMGVLFPHASDFVRLAYPHSVFTYHGTIFKASGTKEEVDNMLSYSGASNELWDNIAMEAIGLTKREYKKYSSFENIIYGYQALEIGTNGMVDGLIVKDNLNGTYIIKTRDGNKLLDVTKHRRGDIKNLPVITA